MKRTIIVGTVIVGIVIVAAAIVLPLLLDVERHRPRIEQALSAATGREVTLGRLRLNLFPAPRLTAAGMIVGEDPRFGEDRFLTADRVEVRVRLWPLLSGRVSIESVTIDAPRIVLRRGRDQGWNIAGLVRAGAGGGRPEAERAAARPGKRRDPGTGASPEGEGSSSERTSSVTLSVDRLSLVNGTVTLTDEGVVRGRQITTEAHKIDLSLTDLSGSAAMGVDLSFEVEGSGRAGLKGELGPYAGGGAAGSGYPIDARVTLDAFKGGPASPYIAALTGIRIFGGELTADLKVEGSAPGDLRVSGDASLKGLEAPSVSGETGQRMRLDAKIGLDGAFKHGAVRLDRCDLKIGRSAVSLTGTGSKRGEHVALDVKVSSTNLDLDELIPLLSPPAQAPSAASSTSASRNDREVVFVRQEQGSAGGVAVGRDFTLRGEMSIEQAKVLNLKLNRARASIVFEKGEARLREVSLDLYKGSLQGEASADLSESGPPFRLSAAVQGVDFNALASDFSMDLRGLVFGTLQADLDVRGRGIAKGDLRRNLTGHGSLTLRDGKITSFGILKKLAVALEAAGGRGIGAAETPFSSLTGTFDIEKGRATTSDLRFDSADIVMKGNGNVALDLSLDLDVAARISPAVSADMIAKTPSLRYLLDDHDHLQMDLAFGGTLVEPSVGVDPATLRRAARSAAKEQLREKGRSLLDKLLKKEKP